MNDSICPLILKRHIYTLHISFIRRLIFNAHVHVMYHKQLCCLQPTTSYHTVLGFPILARVPAQNFSKFDFIHVTFCTCSFRMDLLVQNDHLFYRKGQVIGGRPGELKLKKIDPKQLSRIQSKLNVITGPTAHELRRSYTAGECSAEQAMVQVIAVRVTTARQLMHRKPEGRSN